MKYFRLILVLFVSGCLHSKIHIDENLEIDLRNKKKYSVYVNLLNKAECKDSSALKDFLKIDYLYDGSSYSHGFVLVKLMKDIGDSVFSSSLVGIKEEQLGMLRSYFKAGLENSGKEMDFLIPNFKKSFKAIGFSNRELNDLR